MEEPQGMFVSSKWQEILQDSTLNSSGLPDLSLIQQEVDALEELSRQLFLETADLHATKVQSKEPVQMSDGQIDSPGEDEQNRQK